MQFSLNYDYADLAKNIRSLPLGKSAPPSLHPSVYMPLHSQPSIGCLFSM